MRKNNKKLTLTSQTVRSLQESTLTAAAGGVITNSCNGTCYYTCHVKTPGCPV